MARYQPLTELISSADEVPPPPEKVVVSSDSSRPRHHLFRSGGRGPMMAQTHRLVRQSHLWRTDRRVGLILHKICITVVTIASYSHFSHFIWFYFKTTTFNLQLLCIHTHTDTNTTNANENCAERGKINPPKRNKGSSKIINWTECDKCKFSYHVACVNSLPASDNDQFVCALRYILEKWYLIVIKAFKSECALCVTGNESV